VRPPRQPYALDTPEFTFAAIAMLASRAALGGARETALAAFVTARLADGLRAGTLSAETRRARAAGARKWLATISISEPARLVFAELIDATEVDAAAAAVALRRVIEVTAGVLDGPARQDLERLAGELTPQAVGGS
jgi:hypothetical protein